MAQRPTKKKEAYQASAVNSYIGSRIQAVRKAMGISQKELIYRITTPVSQQQISSYETGQTPISAHLLFEISHILGVAAETFFPCTQRPSEETLLDKKTLENAYEAAMDSFTKVSSITPGEEQQLRKLLTCLYKP